MADHLYTLTFNSKKKNNAELIKVILELAELEERLPHDTARRLMVECGKKRIVELKKKG